ncbi:MAG: OmpA family protein [Deltaproteobacteria bacterium]|nr:OmpA family protein [Deltaproteobacteria bacterium]
MAKLTPLAKILLSGTIIAVTGAVAWNLGLKDALNKGKQPSGTTASSGASSGGSSGAASGATPAAPPKPEPPKPRSGGPLGSKENPLRVSIVSFHGYAPALVANGKSLTTQPGSIYAQKGVEVSFVIQDDIPTLTTIFTAKTAECAWRTSDFWAQEQPNLRNSGHDGRAVVIVDNTRGADAVIAKDPSIQRVEDLAGKRVALLQFTPSHGMVTDAIENSSLTARKKQTVQMVYINAEEGTAGVRAAFESGSVDAAALWDPDLSLAIKKVPGAHVVYSTKTATDLIYDVMVCDQRALATPDGEAAIGKFVDGWLDGVKAAEANPDDAVDALVKTEEFFQLLVKDHGEAFVKELFSNLDWTGLEDNVRILGLAGGTNHYERVYKRFDQVYRAAGALANPNSPVINPPDSFEYKFVKSLLSSAPAARTEAAKPQFTFSETEREKVAQKAATLTKPVAVTFKSGSAELTKRAQKTIDDDMVPLIENNGSAYFEVSGNTDSVGSKETNLKLSQQRAVAVVSYLTGEWEFPKQRFKIVGNGSSKPLCDESNPGAEELTLEQCREMNRSTRLAILSR